LCGTETLLFSQEANPRSYPGPAWAEIREATKSNARLPMAPRAFERNILNIMVWFFGGKRRETLTDNFTIGRQEFTVCN
jgi:hypothetical protein